MKKHQKKEIECEEKKIDLKFIPNTSSSKQSHQKVNLIEESKSSYSKQTANDQKDVKTNLKFKINSKGQTFMRNKVESNKEEEKKWDIPYDTVSTFYQ